MQKDEKLHCEICGDEDLSHGAVWDDEEGSKRAVCGQCDRWLHATHIIINLPKVTIFHYPMNLGRGGQCIKKRS